MHNFLRGITYQKLIFYGRIPLKANMALALISAHFKNRGCIKIKTNIMVAIEAGKFYLFAISKGSVKHTGRFGISDDVEIHMVGGRWKTLNVYRTIKPNTAKC